MFQFALQIESKSYNERYPGNWQYLSLHYSEVKEMTNYQPKLTHLKKNNGKKSPQLQPLNLNDLEMVVGAVNIGVVVVARDKVSHVGGGGGKG